MSDKLLLLVAASTSLTWGLTGIFIRLLPPISPMLVAAGRLFIALLVVLPIILLLRNRQHGLAIVYKRPIAYLLASLLVAYYLLATIAFQLAPVAEVALLLSTPPLFVLGLRCWYGTKPAMREVAGALLALAGMLVIMLPKITVSGQLSTQQVLGDIAAITAALMTALYAFAYKILAEQGKAPEASGVALLTFAVGSFVLAAIFACNASPADFEPINMRALYLFIGLGVLSTAIPTFGFALASKRLPAIITTSISLFIPLFAGLFAYLILGESLSLNFLLGSLLVIGGVILIIRQTNIKAVIILK
ncbi:DMT family transporter [Paraglaciecola sp.]|uniref:DMT family transporter n=1 Tax=Paraglaciecola sp. TaxID=1920173 RepID=UPI0030F44F0D